MTWPPGVKFDGNSGEAQTVCVEGSVAVCWQNKGRRLFISFCFSLLLNTTVAFVHVHHSLGGRRRRHQLCFFFQLGPHQPTQSDPCQPGLIKAALRPRGLQTQHCFCRPSQPRCIPPLGGGGRGGAGGEQVGEVLLIRAKESIPWLGRTLFHSLLVEIKQFIFMYVFWRPCCFHSAAH